MRVYCGIIVFSFTMSVFAAPQSDQVNTGLDKLVGLCTAALASNSDIESTTNTCEGSRSTIKSIARDSRHDLLITIKIAEIKWSQAKYTEAYNYFTEAVAIAIKLKDSNTVLNLRVRQANAQLLRGKSFEAEVLLRDAIARFKAIGLLKTVQGASALSRYGDTMLYLGQLSEARDAYASAAEIFEAIHPKGYAAQLNNQLRYGEQFERQNLFSQAEREFARLLELSQLPPGNVKYRDLANERLAWIAKQTASAN